MPISEVFCCDCNDYMQQLPDKKISLAIVDPPYGNGISKKSRYGNKVTISKHSKNGKYVSVINKTEFISKNWDLKTPDKEYFNELLRVSKEQIIWGVNYYNYKFDSGRIVWDKVNGQTSFSDCEIAYCSYHTSVRLFAYMWNGMMQGESRENGRKQQGNKQLNEERIHPTQKPVELYKWLLEKYAKPGDVIFDSHMGSQSSRIAAYEMGFDYYGCELDPDYFREGCERFEAYRQKKEEIAQFGFAKSELGKTNPILFE
jgi:site-specific DNA-methyltransferase (adenine-specific)